MADRVKYFLLGLLFLVVAGVIAFDRWNSREPMGPDEASARADDSGEIWINPPNRGTQEPEPLRIDPNGGTPPAELRNGTRGGGKEVGYLPPLDDDGEDADDPAPKPLPKPEPKPAPAPRTDKVHVVRSGETLGEIAQQYYPGSAASGLRLIVEANKIENPNVIRENTRLVIPSAMVDGPARKPVVVDRPPSNSSPAKKGSERATGGIPKTYTVKSNDGDLYAILRKFYGTAGEGARIVKVMEMNDLISPRVKAGTVLKLPPK